MRLPSKFGLLLGILAVIGSMPAAAQASTLDQSNEQASGCSTNIGYFEVVTRGFFQNSVAQTFTAGRTGTLDRVELALGRSVQTTEPLIVELRNVVDGVPGAEVLASTVLPAESVPVGTATFIPVVFDRPATVTAGTHYAIVAYTAGQLGQVYFTACTYGDAYPAGAWFSSSEASRPPTTWTNSDLDGLDLWFRTFVSDCRGRTRTVASGRVTISISKCAKTKPKAKPKPKPKYGRPSNDDS